MVGGRRRQQFADAIRDASAKAGSLVIATLALAAAAVMLTVAVLIYAVRARRA